MIRLRFVHCPSVIGDAILAYTGGRYSHVEAITPDGKYLGAHADGGVLAREPNYDKGQWSRQLIVELSASDEMTASFYHYLDAVIGEPYSFAAIAHMLTHADIMTHHRVICSALQTLALRACGWFPYQLAQPAHTISPSVLLLMVAVTMQLPDEQTP